MIATAIALIAYSSDEVSNYGTFKMAQNAEQSVKIVGTLVKEKELYYDAMKDPNYFSFYMKDGDGDESKVVMYDARPRDFEMSEQVVVTGKFDEDVFIAEDILIKCPSKYKDEEVYIKTKEK